MTTFADPRQLISDTDLIEAHSQFGEIEIMPMGIFQEHYEGLGWHLHSAVASTAPAANVFVDGEHRAFQCGAEAWLYADDMTTEGRTVHTDLWDDNPECTCGQGHTIRH